MLLTKPQVGVGVARQQSDSPKERLARYRRKARSAREAALGAKTEALRTSYDSLARLWDILGDELHPPPRKHLEDWLAATQRVHVQ